MLLFRQVNELQLYIAQQRMQGLRIGFAPTMGALHEGHLELVRLSNQHCDVTVVSIFVNPTQFNDPKDLEKYPRTPEKDMALLTEAGCHVLFMPPVEEVYPPGKSLNVHLEFGQLDEVLEGVFRPGHFAGMATVVNRLLNIVRPDTIFMGQKDYQQMSIVREMLYQTGSGTELVVCPTRREPDGLAMSSRNVRLSPEMRAAAPKIHAILQEAKGQFASKKASVIVAWAIEALKSAGFRPEYFEIVDGIRLLPVQKHGASPLIVACTALWAGDVRLIDTIVFEGTL